MSSKKTYTLSSGSLRNNFHDSTVITWHSLHEQRAPSRAWYVIVSAIGIVGLVASAFFGNLLFGIILATGTLTVMLMGTRPAQVVQYVISKRGVHIDRQLFPYNTLESFCVHELNDDSDNVIVLKSSRAFMPLVVIPLIGIRPDTVRNYLSQFMKEVEHNIPFAHHLASALGF